VLNLGSAPGSHRCGPRACAKSSTDPWQDERWHQTLKNRILLDSCYLPGDLEGQNTILPVFFHEPRGEVSFTSRPASMEHAPTGHPFGLQHRRRWCRQRRGTLRRRARLHLCGWRALLASHWAVDFNATVKLITTAAAELALDSTIGCTEAMRRAMLSVIKNSSPIEALPFIGLRLSVRSRISEIVEAP